MWSLCVIVIPFQIKPVIQTVLYEENYLLNILHIDYHSYQLELVLLNK